MYQHIESSITGALWEALWLWNWPRKNRLTDWFWNQAFPSVTYMAQKANPLLPLWRLLRTKYDSAAKVPHLQAPLLQMHGDSDDTVPLEAGRALFEAAANTPKEFYVIPGADHNDTYLVGGTPYWDKAPRVHRQLERVRYLG